MLVLASSVFVVAAAAGAALMSRERLSESGVEQTVRQASHAADAAIDLVWKTLNTSSTWRSTAAAGTWRSALQLGDIAVDVKIEDPADGVLSNDSIGPVQITARATAGEVVQMRSIVLEVSTNDPTRLVERPGTRRRAVLP